MANISLDFSNNALFQKNKITKTYTYKDIGTDNLRLYTIQQGQGYFKEDKLKVYDKNTFNLDMNAIKSAIRNIFKFRKGQAILQPTFGNELYLYMYQPINEITGQKILRTISDLLNIWQPRITILDILVNTNIQQFQYFIEIKYFVPNLQEQDTISLVLSKDNIYI